MAQTYFPFDSGQGANVTEDMWGQMAQLWMATGVVKGQLNQLNAYADSTGMQAKVDTGMAWIQGYFYKSDTLVTLPIATADPTNPRIDRIVVRVDWGANTIQLAVLQGVPAASPAAPALTKNASIYEISLAQVRVNAAATTIAAGNITDERYFVANLNGMNAGDRLEHGSVTINTTANANTTVSFNFSRPFAARPDLTASVINSTSADSFGRIVTSVSNTGASITIYATVAAAVNISWIAVGI